MRTKIMTLGLICLFIFAYCTSPADPEIKKIIEQKVNLPIIEYFLATPTSLDYRQKSTLKWKVINANKIEIDNGIGIVEIVGMREITPRETTTYILIATNDDGNTKQSCKVVCKSGYLKEYWGYPSIGIGDYAIHVHGKVRNNGWTLVYNPKVTVKIYLFGELLATKEKKLCDKLEPGEDTLWEIIFGDPENYMSNNWSNLILISAYE